MRILTLLAGENSRAAATDLTAEIRRFNAEIDFRLRFLHVEIEEVHVVLTAAQEAVQSDEGSAPPIVVSETGPLQLAARLALLFSQERPDAAVIVGPGDLSDAGFAAGAVTGIKMATFGPPAEASDAVKGSEAGVLDLGADAAVAVERLTGVAREIR